METSPRENAPDQGLVNLETVRKIQNYVKMDLTEEEATDLVVLEGIEQQGGSLTDSEVEKKRVYLDKLQKHASRT